MIKYPNKKKIDTNKNISFSNRGMNLEDDINQTNAYYLNHNIAVVNKKPTPIQIVEVDYPCRNKAEITKAYFKTPSTTDYNGVYQGYYLDFEAKETHSKTSFALSLLHKHQLDHFKAVIQQNAIAFVIIRFTKIDQTYLVMVKHILSFIANDTKKSLSLSWINEHGYLLQSNYQPRLDYITAIKAIIEEEKNG
ncbi:MAG: Holliday junction resolvase RecU [Erysipelotrichaceae bacterium]